MGKKLILLLVLLGAALSVSNLRKDANSVQAPEERQNKLFVVDLKKSTGSADHQRNVLNFVKLHQSYMYGDRETTELLGGDYG